MATGQVDWQSLMGFLDDYRTSASEAEPPPASREEASPAGRPQSLSRPNEPWRFYHPPQPKSRFGAVPTELDLSYRPPVYVPPPPPAPSRQGRLASLLKR